MNKPGSKYGDYQPRQSHRRSVMRATLDAHMDTMSKEERMAVNKIAKHYALFIPGLGERGAKELIWRLRYALLEPEEFLDDR